MRLFSYGAAAGIALVLVATAAAAPAPQTLTFNMSTVTEGQGMHVNATAKVWVKGDKARVESNHPMTGPIVLLVDGARLHRLFPQQKRGTVETIPTGKSGPKNPMQFIVANVGQLTQGAKKVGQQTIDGYPCDIYLHTKKGEGRSRALKSWITRTTQPRLPLKVESIDQVNRPNVTMKQSQTTRLTRIKKGVAIPDSLFQLPAGYKIVEAGAPGTPGMPGPAGLGGPGLRP
jgi:hypothetical protein